MKNTVTQNQIDNILHEACWNVETVYDKCTVVTCKLPNGFIIVESSACVDKVNYDVTMGEMICRQRIANKVWELEGYCLQNKLYEEGK